MEDHRLHSDFGNEYYYDIRYKKKKSGKKRIIHAPNLKLKTLQKEFSEWFYKVNKKTFDSNLQITGFLPGRSIADNARPHLDKDWVVTMDIQDFFPSTAGYLVERELEKLPFSSSWKYWFRDKKPTAFKQLSIKDLCNILLIQKKGFAYELPQGSPASPIIANYIAIKEVDKIVQEVCGFMTLDDVSYTRYADDITISFNGTSSERRLAEDLIRQVMGRLTGPYKIKESKTIIKHKSQRQLVTGVVVNGKDPRIDRRLMNNMRAAIHNKNKSKGELSPEIKGMLSFIESINKEQYAKLSSKIGD